MIAALVVSLKRSFCDWIGYRGKLMTHDELLERIRADVTDRDVDMLLPPSLRKYEPAEPKPPSDGGAQI